MPGENDIGGKVGLDISDFKTNIAALNQQCKVIQSGFKAAAAGMDDWSKNAEGLQLRIKSLNEVTDLQKQKIDNLKAMYTKLASEGNTSERALQDLEIRINKETEALNKNQSELNSTVKKLRDLEAEEKDAGQAADGMGNDVKQATDKIEKADKETKNWDGTLGKVGSTLKSGVSAGLGVAAVGVAAFATAAVAAAAGVGKLVENGVELADTLSATSAQTGITTETLQVWNYAAIRNDVSTESMTKGLAKTVMAMKTAGKAGNDYIEVSDGLNVSTTLANGSLKSSERMFYDSIDAIGGLANETDREIATQALFGKSYQEMMPLIEGGSESLNKYAQEAKNMGVVLDSEVIKSLDNFGDDLDVTKMQLETAGTLFASSLIPALQEGTSQLTEVASEMNKALSDGFQPEDVKKIGSMISEKLVDGIGQIATYIPAIAEMLSSTISQAITVLVTLLPTLLPPILAAALSLLQGVLDAVLENLQPLMDMVMTMMTQLATFILSNLPTIIQAGMQILVSLIQGLAEALPELITYLPGIITSIVDTLVANLPAIINAAIQILLALITGIASAIPQLIAMLPTLITTIVDTLMQNLPLIIETAIQILLALITGLVDAIPALIEMVPDIIISIVTALINALPMIIEAAIQIIGALLTGIIDAASSLSESGPEILEKIKTALGAIDWGTLGKNIIDGIKNGITNAASALGDAAKEAAESALNAVKNFLGIKSPSTVMRDQVGKYIPAGIAQGVKDNTDLATVAMSDLSRKLVTNGEVNISSNVSGSATNAAAAQSPVMFNFDGAQFWIREEADIKKLSRQFLADFTSTKIARGTA